MEFSFGGNSGMTYDQLQRKRKLADAMLAQNMATPKNVGEGFNAIARALMAKKMNKKADAAEGEMRTDFNAQMAALLGGGGVSGDGGGGRAPSGTWTPDAPAPKATETYMGMPDVASGGLAFGGKPKADAGVASGGTDFGAAVMTPQEMLIEGAKRRGLDPIDVATAISYETGGKFDPTIKGPTTQWGSHEGLIQFGDPQGVEHGAVFDQGPEAAWRSQLNPDSGAVWSYLDSVGVQPGMGLPQIYSGINAGGVDRMGASDANNGGAPGTVADKVAGMGPHRDKAAAFLGGTWTPDGGQPSGDITMSAKDAPASAPQGGGMAMGGDIGQLIAMMDSPLASPGQKAVLGAMLERQMATMQPADPMDAIALEKAQLELAQMKNPGQQQPEELTERTALLSAAGIDPASPEGQSYLLTGKLPGAAGGDQPAGFASMDMQAQAAGLVPGTPEYQDFMRNGGGSGTPAAFTALDMQAQAAGFVPGTPEYQEFMATRGAGLAEGAKVKANATAEAEIAAPGDVATAETTLGYIDSLRNHPGREWGSGGSAWTGMIPGTGAKEFQIEVERLKSGAFMTAIEQLRGMGALSNAEGQTATAAVAALDPSGTQEGFLKRLAEYEEIVKRGRDRAAKRMKAPADATDAPAPVSITSDAEYDALPSGTTFIDPEGKTRRKP